MKTALRHWVLLLALSSLYACSKQKMDPPYHLPGTWIGKIGTGTATPSGYYELTIKESGAIERISASGSVSAVGTWELQANNFIASYTFSDNGETVTLEATLNKTKNEITGNWANSGNSGSFFVIKNLQ